MRDALELPRGIRVPLREIDVETHRSQGPGGQHVNRTESGVTLRFALEASPSIPEGDRAMAARRLASRLTKKGEVLVRCEAHRDRPRNLQDAYDRLERMLTAALERRTPRRATRPTRGSVERRLQGKRQRSDVKRDRRRPPRDD